MKTVYRYCWCNFAVTGFPDGSEGIFGQREAALLFEPAKLRVGSESYILIDTNHWISGVEKAPLNRRAWVFQERALSSRTIHFGRHQLFWECTTYCASETFPEKLPFKMETLKGEDILSLKERMKYDDNSLHIWFVLATYYNLLEITYERDRLAALSGIAQYISSTASAEYVAGLWKTHPFWGQLH